MTDVLPNGMTRGDIEISRMIEDRCPMCGSLDTTYADWTWDGDDEYPYGTQCNACGHDTVFGPKKPFVMPGSDGSFDTWEEYEDDGLG